MMHIWKAGVHWMKSLTQFGMPMNGYRLDLVVKFLEVHTVPKRYTPRKGAVPRIRYVSEIEKY